jgi:hypothetical protein
MIVQVVRIDLYDTDPNDSCLSLIEQHYKKLKCLPRVLAANWKLIFNLWKSFHPVGRPQWRETHFLSSHTAFYEWLALG